MSTQIIRVFDGQIIRISSVRHSKGKQQKSEQFLSETIFIRLQIYAIFELLFTFNLIFIFMSVPIRIDDFLENNADGGVWWCHDSPLQMTVSSLVKHTRSHFKPSSQSYRK